MKPSSIYKLLLPSFALCVILACNTFLPTTRPTPIIPSPIPAIETSAPLLSQQVTVADHVIDQTNQTPSFTIKALIPQLSGSDDPRVTAFNQRLDAIVTSEVDTWRQSFLQNTYPTVTNGSFLETKYTQILQSGDLWSFKFDFFFYSDGAAHPGSYSAILNYDLGQGKELALADLFLPNSDYLGAISTYCIAELSKQEFFEGSFEDGALPKPENYTRWNITANGLLITFDEYQVAPHAAGPQQVLVPYVELESAIDPDGPLAAIVR